MSDWWWGWQRYRTFCYDQLSCFFTALTFLLFNLTLGALIPGSLTEPGNLFQKKYAVQSWVSFYLVRSHALPAVLWDFLRALLSPLGHIYLFHSPLTLSSMLILMPPFLLVPLSLLSIMLMAHFVLVSLWPLGRLLMPPFFTRSALTLWQNVNATFLCLFLLLLPLWPHSKMFCHVFYLFHSGQQKINATLKKRKKITHSRSAKD